MKVALSLFAAAVAAVIILVSSPVHADITYDDSSYGLSSFYNAGGSNAIVSYDWGSNQNLYYETSASYNFGGFYQFNGTTTTMLSSAPSDFAGASVVAVGNYVYYNSSDTSGNENIYQYGPTNGTPTLSLSSTALNYGLYAQNHSGNLYITGAAYPDPNHIYSATLNASTGAVGTPTDLGQQGSGSPGPLAFDSVGNLYYAPGADDQSIYKWSAAEVAAGNLSLTADGVNHLWADYSQTSSLNIYSGATSMVISNGQVLLTLTSFGPPSALVAFSIDGSGNAESPDEILNSTTDLLGELRTNNGNTYISDGNTIYKITAAPEPSSWWLLVAGLVALGIYGRRRIA